MKVLFLVNIPAPYRVDFFNTLGQQCDLTVLIEGKKAGHRNDDWLNRRATNFQVHYLSPVRIGRISVCTDVKKYLSKEYDMIVIGVYNTPTSIYAMREMRRKKIPYIISVDGGYIKNEAFYKSWYKRKLLSSAVAWLSPSEASDQYLIHYGAEKKRICRYHFTSLTEKDLADADVLRASERNIIKNELQMREKRILLSIGRFSYNKGYGKGYDTLLRAAEQFSDEIGVYIVGDEPTEEFVEWKKTKKLDHVHYVGYCTKAEIAKYYAAADIFVLLTRGDVWGLVINEAMAFSLPIVTTPQCVAGIELVRNEENGYLVSADNETETINIVGHLMENDILREKFGLFSRQKIKQYTIEEMSRQHMTIFEGLKHGRY